MRDHSDLILYCVSKITEEKMDRKSVYQIYLTNTKSYNCFIKIDSSINFLLKYKYSITID